MMNWKFWHRERGSESSPARRSTDSVTPLSPLMRSLRILLAAFQATGWALVWLVGVPLAIVGLMCLWYLIHERSLEVVAIWISNLTSHVLYAVDVKTGWLSTELPKVFGMGLGAYLAQLDPGVYFGVAWRVALALLLAVLVFFFSTYPKRLRRYASVCAVNVFVLVMLGWYLALDPIKDPPSYGTQLRDFKMKATTYVTDASGLVEMGCFAHENRDPVPIVEVSTDLRSAILASEDHTFYDHSGFNMYAMVRAGMANAIKAQIASGASTLTMQLTKNVFLTPERSYVRKVREVVIASHLEHTVSKDHLLYLYVNLVYFGGSYGVEAASRSYFGKSAKDVSIAEAAFLAALINQPEAFRLGGDMGKKRIMARKDRVIKLMAERGFITRGQAALAQAEELSPLPYAGTCKRTHAYISAAVNREYGVRQQIPIASAGLTVHSTIDLRAQKALEEACVSTVAEYTKRHPDNADTIQCSALAVQIASGEVLAMVGGQDFRQNQYDNAMQSRRQAGSTFKPFLFAAYVEMLERKMRIEQETDCLLRAEDPCQALALPVDLLTPCTVLDARVWVPQVVGWKGKIVSRHPIDNYPYEGRPQYRGKISCALALGESRNTATIWGVGQLAPEGSDELSRWNHGARAVASMAYRLGIESELEHLSVTGKTDEERATRLPNYTLAIGSAEVTLWEMARAFLPMINGGCKKDISFVRTAIDVDGKVVYRHNPNAPCVRVLSPNTANAMRELLQAPVDVRGSRSSIGHGEELLGTAASLRKVFPEGELYGKTGTATGPDGSSSTENWFIGATSTVLVATRLNNIEKTPLGRKETGGRNALPVFRQFVQVMDYHQPSVHLPAIDLSASWEIPPVLSGR
jgi:penicillin-binding protein 1A